ncbi:MAG: DEAD/DEAH box helicase family protein [Atopobiaceae bacterium]|jgi:superfamily II DNA or RNA helicase|nr:DEAD/DEAH box helicase family protein [Atopobiaceae bacterium]MCH4119645.1 DEAD/DEAH box helicase family protein [Atopobiaceae bacterium]MCI1388716.1 DEAD/DEAH box helicase family protein [Atopobiaceae bacterium]MCI1432664.1 DEAD/DEAH box helicase family protein [Atopobiaceae bacterium]MCI1470999.1 DEAD/DEAH box helicase family protein [Atopobiaceae bacterium]
MKVELKQFQEDAVYELLQRIRMMREIYDQYNSRSAVSLTAPTGSGKTVMAAAAIEALFFGDIDAGIEGDPKACVLWLSDSPSLNDQTRARFVEVSDKLANWFTDQRHLEVVENNFGASHEVLEPHHVYFLNKQLLSKNSNLNKASELNAGRIFWDILEATIQDPACHLYLFIDEAHRGLGVNASDDEGVRASIYANLIDGFEGRSPMPVVVGISATPQRFENAMTQRKNRALQPSVEVSPKDVQESGLLKDTIELRVPEEDDAVEHQYLDMACDRLLAAEKAWRVYCDEEGIVPAVAPLMVVQVADNTGDGSLKSLCDQIVRKLPHLDTRTCFANVFGEHKDHVPTPQYFIPYVEPENVQVDRSIRVLFAKEAISNGWDCPRAEVIFSQRRRSDDTYIAQLVGRMVRTPLARRVESDETLNSVACYLPQFNPDATQSVIDYLTGKSDDFLGKSIVKQVFTNPVTVSWNEPNDDDGEVITDAGGDGAQASQPEFELEYPDEQPGDMPEAGSAAASGASSSDNDEPVSVPAPASDNVDGSALPQTPQHTNTTLPTKPAAKKKHVMVFTPEELSGIKLAWATLRKRVHPKKPRNQFVSLIRTATLLMETELDQGAGQDVRDEFCKRVEAEMVAFSDEYQNQRHNVEIAEMQVITIDKRNDNEVTRISEEPLIDAYGLRKAAEQAQIVFGGKEFVNAYRKRKILGEGADEDDVNLILAAVARTAEIVEALEDWADKKRVDYFDKHSPDRAFMKEEDRQRFDALRAETSGVHDIPVEFPSNLVLDGNLPRYDGHILYDPEDGKCPLDLNDWEIDVLRTEMARKRTIGFYRIPNNFQPSVFSIPYTMPDGRRALRPDFLFFVRDSHDVIRPSIVDPHGDFLGDSLPKLKGYVAYLKDYPDEFVQVLSVSKVPGGTYRFLDLLDKETQTAIEQFEGDHVDELYSGAHSHPYQIAQV